MARNIFTIHEDTALETERYLNEMGIQIGSPVWTQIEGAGWWSLSGEDEDGPYIYFEDYDNPGFVHFIKIENCEKQGYKLYRNQPIEIENFREAT